MDAFARYVNIVMSLKDDVIALILTQTKVTSDSLSRTTVGFVLCKVFCPIRSYVQMSYDSSFSEKGWVLPYKRYMCVPWMLSFRKGRGSNN